MRGATSSKAPSFCPRVPLTHTLNRTMDVPSQRLSNAVRRELVLSLWVLTMTGACAAPPPRTPTAPRAQDTNPVVEVAPSHDPAPYFVRDGKPFCFSGFNNYYLMYKDRAAVTDVLDSAQQLGARVIRTW